MPSRPAIAVFSAALLICLTAPSHAQDAPPPAATQPAPDATAAQPPTDSELQKQRTGVEREFGAEDRKFQQQMTMLQGVQDRAIANGSSDNVDQAAQAIDDEKTRHAERVQDLSDQWASIQADLDSRHPPAAAPDQP